MTDESTEQSAVRRLIHQVKSVELGDATSFEDGKLTVAEDEVKACFDSPALGEVKLTWTSPGDSVRIVKILDSVEPRTRDETEGGIFPGFVGPPRSSGSGDIHVLRGVSVVAAGYLPRAQEGLVDMSGPAAELSPLGSTHNLVVEFTPSEDEDWAAVDREVRKGLLAAAARLAEAAVDVEPDETEQLMAKTRDRDAGDADLPRVGAITNLQTQGNFKDVFVYGRSFSEGLATVFDPAEVDAGAIVSGQFGHPALKNPTWMHQNHPVITALRERDGDDLTFAGLVISPEPKESAQKELISAHAARVVAALGWDGAIVTKEGGGNADGDMSLKMDAMSEAGIVSVGIFAEMSGAEGTGPPVVVPPTKAKGGMISTGNYDERITLPAMDKALGGERFALLDVPATDEMTVPHAVIYCSLSPLGWGRLTAQEGVSEAFAPPAEEKEEHEGPIRIVHYINQFFAGVGGEDKADTKPAKKEGAVGPGKRLEQLLGDDYEIVATVYCGDDHAVSDPSVTEEILEMVKEAEPDLLVAGPAFTSGRNGLACARLAAKAQEAGIPVIASLHQDNPGIDEAAGAPIVAAEDSARKMKPTLERLVDAVKKVATGEPFTAEDGRVGKAPRRNTKVERNAAERAVDLLLARLGGDAEATEVPLPRFERVKPAGPVEDVSQVRIALVTEGAVVPDGNPDNLESARAEKWLRYSLEDVDSLSPDKWQSVHGGFSTQWANEDPHRILPVDVARELVEEGKIGSLHDEYFVTAGNGTAVNNAKRFGVEWAADLRESEVRAAILTST